MPAHPVNQRTSDVSATSRHLVFAALIAVMLLLAGCVGRPEAPATQAPPASPQVPPPAGAGLPAVDVAALTMPIPRRQTELGADFPFQVPVIEGEISSAGAVGESVWEYVVDVGLDQATVLAYYKRAYPGANWSQTREDASAGGSRVTLYFAKGAGAESIIVVEPADAGTRVTGTIGIGAGITETF